MLQYNFFHYCTFFCSRFEPQGAGPPLLAESESGQRGEHARLPQRHSPPDTRAERGPGDHQAAAEPEPSRAPRYAQRREPLQPLRHEPVEGHHELGLHPNKFDVGPPEPQPPPTGAQQAVPVRPDQFPEAEQPGPAQVAALKRGVPQPADFAAPDQELRAPAEFQSDGSFHPRS